MLHENLKALRKGKGLSQEELAIKLNVVRQTISKWETGQSVPDATMLIRIAEALDTTVQTLLDEAPPSGEATDTQVLASKLEVLNEQFARQNERRRRVWRTVFLLVGAATVLLLFVHLTPLFYSFFLDVQGISLIGGYDGPTQIYLSSSAIAPGPLVAALLVLAGCGIGLYYTGKK